MTFPYGTTHSDILGPECLILLADPGSAPLPQSTKAIVDSGADITVIPKKYEEFLTYDSDSIKLCAANGESTLASVKIVDIYLGDEFTLPFQVKVALIDWCPYVILGRNLLNQSKVVLEAPLGQWRINCKDCSTCSISI